MDQSYQSEETAAFPPATHFPVVGVGASAGGLEAIEAFFESMPIDSGMAFIVVQHLSPDFKSQMGELIARKTDIPIVPVTDQIRVEPNTIYFMPAKKEMVIRQGELLLSDRGAQRGLLKPIDRFLSSLAADVADRSVGVILSGTGSDGTQGVKDIHTAGGLVIAQDEESAKFDGMPVSAQRTGIVDAVLPPERMAPAILRFISGGVAREIVSGAQGSLDSNESLEQAFQLLKRKFGIDFSQYKSTTVGRRIQRRLEMANFTELDEYVERLSTDARELDELYRDLLIGVTRFFRDAEAFGLIESNVIPGLFQRATEDNPVRAWVCGCASGEEAYSLAMLMDEHRRRLGTKIDFKIFATDAHPSSIQAASRGFFRDETMDELSADRRQRYFRKSEAGYQVIPELRRSIVFATHNVIRDSPFTQMDLVSCRNMLIYLDPQVQQKVLSFFHFALKPGGTLFLGPSETPSAFGDEFHATDHHWRIYTKRRELSLPLESPRAANPMSESLPRASFLTSKARPRRVDSNVIAAYDELLNQKMGNGFLVSPGGEILHVFGDAQTYLNFSVGRPSTHVLDAIDGNLKASLSAALHQAAKKKSLVRFTEIPFRGDGEADQLVLKIEPIGDPDNGSGNLLVIFETSVSGHDRSAEPLENSLADATGERVEMLESELRYSQENLQATIEEMETSNEELQASNEELIASNEELQSTNEELHSVNEELYTVNAEHQRRVQELAEANADMDNLLAITRVGVVFLDSELRIRRITPAITELLRIGSADIGRPFQDFANRLSHADLIDDLKTTLGGDADSEMRMTDDHGRPYLVRMAAYQSDDDSRGVVMMLIDITSLAEAELQLRMHHMAMESTSNGIVISDPNAEDNPITYANSGFCKLTGYDPAEIVGRNCRFLQGPDTDPESVATLRNAIDNREACRVAILNYRKDGTSFWNDLQITPVFDQQKKLASFIGIQQDITGRIKVQEALEKASLEAKRASEAKSAFMANMSHELRTPMTAVLGFADMLVEELKDENQLEKVSTIKRNGEYLLALLNDILDLSKIEAGQLEIAKDVLSIHEIIDDVRKLMDVRSSQEGVPLTFHSLNDVPSSLTGDKVRIRQILVNLIGNALKFTDRGEVTVKIGARSSEDQHWIDFAVQDTGIGIHTSHLDELFTPFSQTGIERRRRFGGTGLGLSICKRLAEGMHGKISVDSTLGVGSTFTLSLPLSPTEFQSKTDAPGESQPLEETKSLETPPTQIAGRVLVADDRRDIWRIARYFLEKAGASVTVVEDGLQAVEETKRADSQGEPFQLIIMDMQMPVMTGPEAITEIRQLGFEIPIIALTADAMEGEREACLAMGCNDYLPKPIDGLRLIQTVASHLQ